MKPLLDLTNNEITFTSPDQMTDEVMFDLVSHLVRQTKIPDTVNRLSNLCTKEALADFMDDGLVNEFLEQQKGELK